MLNRTSRTTEPAAAEEVKPQKSEGEKQAEEIEEAKDARAQFVRKDIHLAKRFRTRRTGEEEDEVSSDEEVGAEEAHVKQETIKTEQRKYVLYNILNNLINFVYFNEFTQFDFLFLSLILTIAN